MHLLQKLLYCILFLLILSHCQTTESQKKEKTKKDWLGLAMATEQHIQTAKYETELGPSWRVLPDSSNSHADASLYSGMPGIVLFYLELYQATNDKKYLEEAENGADYLVASMQDTLPSASAVGLYTGIAGVSYTLSEVYQVNKKEKYKEAAIKAMDILKNAAEDSLNGIHWGRINDIVYGSAGIGLYLQHMADALELKEADSLAILVAEGLLENAIDTSIGLRWNFMPNYARFMDNFSHGTAGVAYFLVQCYQRYEDYRYLDAALDASLLLESLSNEKGFIPHHFPDGEDLYYHSWCHGAPGTSRLYLALFEATGENKWLEKMEFAAQHMLELGIDSTQTPGFWNNEGKCCGSAGVAEYFLSMYQITGNAEYLEFSNKMTDRVLRNSIQEDRHIKWVHAENRVSPEDLMAQTGLMQGSAGIGLWFLELDAFYKGREPQVILPDKPKISRNIQ